MKTFNFIKIFAVAVISIVANVTIYARGLDNNLVYNTEEVDGMKVAETVYKMNDGILTNYMKYHFKYDAKKQMTENMSQKWNANKNIWENDLCIRYIYENKSVTTEYYKWNAKKEQFVLIPEMTVTMDK